MKTSWWLHAKDLVHQLQISYSAFNVWVWEVCCLPVINNYWLLIIGKPRLQSQTFTLLWFAIKFFRTLFIIQTDKNKRDKNNNNKKKKTNINKSLIFNKLFLLLSYFYFFPFFFTTFFRPVNFPINWCHWILKSFSSLRQKQIKSICDKKNPKEIK